MAHMDLAMDHFQEAIITKRSSFWFGAMGLGAVGMALFALAYL